MGMSWQHRSALALMRRLAQQEAFETQAAFKQGFKQRQLCHPNLIRIEILVSPLRLAISACRSSRPRLRVFLRRPREPIDISRGIGTV